MKYVTILLLLFAAGCSSTSETALNAPTLNLAEGWVYQHAGARYIYQYTWTDTASKPPQQVHLDTLFCDSLGVQDGKPNVEQFHNPVNPSDVTYLAVDPHGDMLNGRTAGGTINWILHPIVSDRIILDNYKDSTDPSGETTSLFHSREFMGRQSIAIPSGTAIAFVVRDSQYMISSRPVRGSDPVRDTSSQVDTWWYVPAIGGFAKMVSASLSLGPDFFIRGAYSYQRELIGYKP